LAPDSGALLSAVECLQHHGQYSACPMRGRAAFQPAGWNPPVRVLCGACLPHRRDRMTGSCGRRRVDPASCFPTTAPAKDGSSCPADPPQALAKPLVEERRPLFAAKSSSAHATTMPNYARTPTAHPEPGRGKVQ
jgi:hypothetical protein